MTDQEKTSKENNGAPFDMASCMEMMGKMKVQLEQGCDCTAIMSEMMGQTGLDGCAEMMESCCRPEEEAQDRAQ